MEGFNIRTKGRTLHHVNDFYGSLNVLLDNWNRRNFKHSCRHLNIVHWEEEAAAGSQNTRLNKIKKKWNKQKGNLNKQIFY